MPHFLRLMALILASLAADFAHTADQPNILWITAEDMSPTLGCYGDDYAITPHIDRLASESVRYTHAFATAPVCSPVRSCLITGVYATSLGTHNMRSAFPLPEDIHGFPSYLRNAGYFTTNNVKTDYNTSSWERLVKESWHESSDTAHWRKRSDDQKGKPFFSVFNLMTSHQSRSMVWTYDRFVKEVQNRLSPEEIHDPAEASLPPYYPDTPVIRKTVARFYDCVTAMDKEVGAILRQLEDDGLADDTIVFFYSDHGSGMPRHKRALLDSGMHVPLLIRFPEKYQHLAPAAPGQTSNRLVSFVDFPPTVLRIADVGIPGDMEGEPFLGSASTEREYAFGHRDRVDEAIDMARSVRSRRYLYIRNYMPHLGYNQPTAWPDLGEIRHEFYRLTDQDSLTPAQWQFAGPTRPFEELYDCEVDPLNLTNLADSPQHAAILKELRKAHREHAHRTRDKGFVPETSAWHLVIPPGRTAPAAPYEKARRADSKFDQMESLVYTEGQDEVWRNGRDRRTVEELAGSRQHQRYWMMMDLRSREVLTKEEAALLKSWLKKPGHRQHWRPPIVVAAVLCQHGEIDAGLPLLIEALGHKDLTLVLHAAREIQLLGDRAQAAIPAMRELLTRAEELRPSDTPATFVQSGDQDLAMFASFAARAFLDGLGDAPESETEWTDLFDGKTLAGWTARADGDVRVANGEIQLHSKGINLWLVHEGEFDDFELTVEALMPDSGYNSGIGFRCVGKGKPKGYQCEIENRKSGMIYAIGSGWVWPKGKEESAQFARMAGECFRAGEWNEFRIRCEDEHMVIHVNGVKTADVTDNRFASGSVALQHHGKGAVHRFRNIRIRRLQAVTQ